MNRLQKFAFITVVLGISACSRVQVVPEEPVAGPETIPPIAVPGEMPPPAQPMPMPMPPSAGGPGMHTVQPGEGLYGIARQYGLSFHDIAAANGIQPPYTIHPGQTLRIPSAGGAMPMPMPGAAPAPSYGGSSQYHTVQRGETLYRVGLRYGIPYQTIAAWNGIAPPYTLSAGQRLLVSPPSGGAAPAPSSGPIIVPFPTPSAAPAYAPPAPSYGGGMYHTVQRGETLYSIAKRYGFHYRDVAAWNGIAPPYSLRVGQSLRVSPPGAGAMNQPAPSAPAVAAAPPPGGVTYAVQRGDTLSTVAARHGQSTSNLAAWNNLRPPYVLKVGQRLNVGSAPKTVASAPMKAASAPPAAQPVVSAPPQPMAQNTATPPPITKTFHTVKKGETLAGIAQRYSQTTHELALWNGLSPPYVLSPAQTLLVLQ